MIEPPPYDAQALAWFARRVDALSALPNAWPAPRWGEGRQAVRSLFGLDRQRHFLLGHRGLLPQLWERQVTQGLQAMLMERPERTVERCQALLDALEGSAAVRLAAVDAITADANDRIDLAVHCRDVAAVRHCVVVEAKLDSPLQVGQLRRYLARLKEHYPDPGQRHLRVVAPTRTTNTTRTLARSENAEWRFMSWRRLLVAWQRALPDDPGDDVLHMFGEIWKRAGGS